MADEIATEDLTSEDLTPDDRRLRKRLAHTLDVLVTSGPMFEAAQSGDISPGGIFVAAKLAYEEGQTVNLRFEIDGRSFHLDAEVAHARGRNGFGARFTSITPEERLHILQFVHRSRAEREAQQLTVDLIPV